MKKMRNATVVLVAIALAGIVSACGGGDGG